MDIICKMIRKIGLGKAVISLAKPLIKSRVALPSVEQARAHLESHSPDPGSSCLCERKADKSGEFDLDIIIPAYNVEKYIKRCIDSALEQETNHSFRLIVIDDGSKDSTGEILDSYAADPRLLIRHQENRGFSGARNAGLELSNAGHIMFLDSDDTLCPGAIEALMRLVCSEDIAIAEGGFNSVDIEGNILSRHRHEAGNLDIRRDLRGYPWGKIFKASLFDGIQLPEGYWYEDSLMAQIIYPLAQKLGLKALGVKDSVYNYTVNPQGISRTGRQSPKSTDSLWITLQLFKDRQKLGLEKDQGYYEYLLHMLVLSYRRAERQGEEIKKAMFILWKDFFEKEFSGFATKNKKYETLQQALRQGNYPLYSAACRLI